MHIDTKWSIGGSSDKSSNDMRRREELVMVVDPIQVPVLVHSHVPVQYHACPCLFISVPIPCLPMPVYINAHSIMRHLRSCSYSSSCCCACAFILVHVPVPISAVVPIFTLLICVPAL